MAPVTRPDGGNGGPSVAEQVAAQISDAIMVGEYPLGTWLRQEQLAQRFGVSRQPIREALRLLDVVGMIEARPRRGVRVNGPEASYIRDGYLIRAELEGLAARLAATRRNEGQLDELKRVLGSFTVAIYEAFGKGSGDDARATWVRDHNRFHELILEASGVDRLAQLVGALNMSLPRNLSIDALRARNALDENIEQHKVILAALELGSAEVAGAAMKEHVRRSGELIGAWFAQQQEALAQGQDAGSARTSRPSTRRANSSSATSTCSSPTCACEG